MKVIIQRVKSASVTVNSQVVGCINQGLLVLLGIARDDTPEKAQELMAKLIELRIFDDEEGKMNRSITEIHGEILVVSQFTLYGNCDKGRRPSFDQAAPADLALKLYEYFVKGLRQTQVPVQTGQFGAMMEVSLINDGPVTFTLER